MTKKHTSTIRDIAKQAGVSETTVSLSFQPKSRISNTTRARVLAIAKELNYVPSIAAKQLRMGRTKTLGLIVNDITESFYSVMSRTATDVAYDKGYRLIYTENGWNGEKAIELTKSLIAQRVEGLILCLCEKEQKSVDLITSMHIPHIVVDTAPDFYTGPYVINNEFAIGEMGGRHLIEQGCKRPVFFNSTREMASFSSFRDQLAGFRKALNKEAIPFLGKDIVYAGFTIEDGRRAVSGVTHDIFPYDGVFCINDDVAYGVMEELEHHGLNVGHDVAVMGIDNLAYSKLNRIALTSINIDYELMTTLAVTTLINGIEKGVPITSRLSLEPELIVRQSTALYNPGNSH